VIDKDWMRLFATAGAMLLAILALAMAPRSSRDCERVQTRILVAGPYEHVSERAGTAARIMCQRNGYVARKWLFHTFDPLHSAP
jgi:hypothetical protein